MRCGIVLPHLGASGGVRRLKMIGERLAARGHDVTLLAMDTATFPLDPSDRIRARRTRFEDLPALCRSLDRLICPGDLALSRIALEIPESCQLYTFHLHLGMHDWPAELGNIRCSRIKKATTARWIQAEIRTLGASCAWFGIAPVDEDLYPLEANRGYRIGTLAHGWYGWKNSIAAVEAYEQVLRAFPQAEFWSYGQTPVCMPGRFFLKPSLSVRRWIYSLCRVWIVPSVSEGIGMCGLEAMLCGAPVVSADNRGIREYADERTCMIYPPAENDVMLAMVLRLLEDWELGARLAEAARARVRAFKQEACIDRIETILCTQ